MKKFSEVVAQTPTKPKNFQEYLDTYAAPVAEIVNEYIDTGTHADIQKYLYSPLLEYSKNGGKRHRPLICFAACAACGGRVDLATSCAAALEHFHTAALIHDDIADSAHTRRGKPCLHISEGEGLAINMGDLALSMVNGTVMKDPALDTNTRVRVVGELLDMTARTVEGQAMDIGWARDGRFDISTQDYLCMATHKTAHYSGGVPLACGAIIAGAPEKTIEGMREYGLATGLAFQIQDDLLNLIGSEESTRKDFRSDITEGKRTLVVVHALQNSTASNRARLIEILSSGTQDAAVLAEAVDIMNASSSIQYAKDYASSLTSEAKVNLGELLEDSCSKDILLSMADWFVNRLQ